MGGDTEVEEYTFGPRNTKKRKSDDIRFFDFRFNNVSEFAEIVPLLEKIIAKIGVVKTRSLIEQLLNELSNDNR